MFCCANYNKSIIFALIIHSLMRKSMYANYHIKTWFFTVEKRLKSKIQSIPALFSCCIMIL